MTWQKARDFFCEVVLEILGNGCAMIDFGA